MKVRELIEQLKNLPQDAKVTAQVRDNGFQGMPANIHWAKQEILRENTYGVWAENWAGSTSDDDRVVIVLN